MLVCRCHDGKGIFFADPCAGFNAFDIAGDDVGIYVSGANRVKRYTAADMFLGIAADQADDTMFGRGIGASALKPPQACN